MVRSNMANHVAEIPPADQPAVACTPNLSGAGRRLRKRIGIALIFVTVLLLIGLVSGGVPWRWRLWLGLPVALTTLSFLQVLRNTCVARAVDGTFEGDDFSRVRVSDVQAAASRRVAMTIGRDALLVGVAGGLLGAATALIR